MNPSTLSLSPPTPHTSHAHTHHTQTPYTKSVRGLAEGLSNFKGAVVFVSHDEEFIENGANQMWHMDGTGKIVQLFCGFSEYKRQIEQGEA